MNTKPVVAIDGPAGAGKTSVARSVARALSVPYLDTGAMYRAAAWAVLDAGVSPSDAEEVARLVGVSEILVKEDSVTVGGVDVTEAIRSPEVTEAVSLVAAYPEVRSGLLALQRDWVRWRNGCVMEGRDISTVVLPDADLKVYLDASPGVRAQRRAGESDADPASVEASIERRDVLDSGREHAPLRRAPDAFVIDTDGLSVDGVVSRILTELRRRKKAGEVGKVSEPVKSPAVSGDPRYGRSRFGERRSLGGSVVHFVMRSSVQIVGFPFFRIRRRHLRRVPRKGALIVAPAGHRSNLDTPLVGGAVPRNMHYMAKDTLFKSPFWSSFLAALGGFPTLRDKVDRRALRYARRVLERGEALVVFPEGERKTGRRVHPLFSGPVWLSEVTGAPILPVGVGGAERAMPKGALIPRPYRVRIVFGEPIPALEKASSRASSIYRRQRASEELREVLQRLFDEAQDWAGTPNDPPSHDP